MRCVTCQKWRPCISRGRFRDILASLDGKTLNSAEVGRRLSLSRTTAMSWLNAYRRSGLVSLLPDYERQRRSVLVVLPEFSEPGTVTPRGKLLGLLRDIQPAFPLSWWKTGRVREIHVIVEIGAERIGFCLTESGFPRRRDLLPLVVGLRRRVIHRGFLLHGAHLASARDAPAVSLPFAEFVSHAHEWLFLWRTARQSRKQAARVNRDANRHANGQCLVRAPVPR